MFAAFDENGDGTVSAHEYLLYSLRAACVQSGKRMVDLFNLWDTDRSNTVGEKEFKQAVRVLGFAVPDDVASKMYRKLDADGNGQLKYTPDELIEPSFFLPFHGRPSLTFHGLLSVPSHGRVPPPSHLPPTTLDGSPPLRYTELMELLAKKQPGAEATKGEMMRYAPGGQQANRDNRLGKPSARDSYNFETIRVRALPIEAQLDKTSDVRSRHEPHAP